MWTPLEIIPKQSGLDVRQARKSVPKTGAALAYANDAVWLLKGNNRQEFWKYTPVTEEAMIARTPITTTTLMSEKTTAPTKLTFEVTPNPFTKMTTIRYTVPISGKVSLKLYNATGSIIETVTDEYLNAGNYTKRLSANTLAKGIYFLKYSDATNSSDLKLIVQ